MFAALCGHDEVSNYIKKHMVRFVAIAPVVKIDSMESPIANGFRTNDFVLSLLEKFTPEVLTMGSTEPPIFKAIVKSKLGSSAPDNVMH